MLSDNNKNLNTANISQNNNGNLNNMPPHVNLSNLVQNPGLQDLQQQILQHLTNEISHSQIANIFPGFAYYSMPQMSSTLLTPVSAAVSNVNNMTLSGLSHFQSQYSANASNDSTTPKPNENLNRSSSNSSLKAKSQSPSPSMLSKSLPHSTLYSSLNSLVNQNAFNNNQNSEQEKSNSNQPMVFTFQPIVQVK